MDGPCYVCECCFCFWFFGLLVCFWKTTHSTCRGQQFFFFFCKKSVKILGFVGYIMVSAYYSLFIFCCHFILLVYILSTNLYKCKNHFPFTRQTNRSLCPQARVVKLCRYAFKKKKSTLALLQVNCFQYNSFSEIEVWQQKLTARGKTF